MAAFLLRRLIYLVLLVIVSSSVAYVLAATQLNPRSRYEGRNPPPPPEVVDAVLDAVNMNNTTPLMDRSGRWAGGVIRGDLGRTIDNTPVSEEIGRRMWVSLRLLLFGALIGPSAGIARAMLGPLGIEPEPLGNHIFMRNQRGYQDNSGEIGKYDPARAAQLLDEAGWKLEGNVRRKDGRLLEINCVIPTAVATSRQESELIQNMLAQLGVRLNINTVPLPDFFEKYVRPGQFDFTLFSWIGTPFPISSSRSLYAKPTVGPGGELAIQQNYARTGSDEIDRLFNEANQELDRTRAIELANRIDALIWQEVHSLTLYQRPEMWVVKSGLANHGAFGFAEEVYEDIGWAKR